MQTMGLREGDAFSSYEDWKNKLDLYQDEHFVVFTVVDSTTVERARKKQSKRTFRYVITN